MNGRLATASEVLLLAAMQSTQPGGPTYRYFEPEGRKEATLRQRFAEHELPEHVDRGSVPEESAEVLRHLNHF